MVDDGYWHDVEIAYTDCINDGMKILDDELWEYAKELVQWRYFLERIKAQAQREKRGFFDVFREQYSCRSERNRQ